jgi:hypothetical protein
MSGTTGPVLTIGAITVVNSTVFNGQPMNWRIPIATGFTAVAFSAAEKIWPQGAAILAYTALITTVLVRVDPATPAPIESAYTWWNRGEKR